MRLSLSVLLLAIGFVTSSSAAQENRSDETDQIDLKAVWNKVVEVNQVWLDPQPKSLSYKVVSGSPPPAQPETTQFVWVSADKARWEMESGDGRDRLDYTLILAPERSQYLRGPQGLLGKPQGRRPLNTLRQAITWQSAIHGFQKQGLPGDAKVVSETKEDNHQRIVVQATPANAWCNVGLGLYHVHYGQSQMRIGAMKLTLRLPEHVPLREEFADGTIIEFGPDFLRSVRVWRRNRCGISAKSPGELIHGRMKSLFMIRGSCPQNFKSWTAFGC